MKNVLISVVMVMIVVVVTGCGPSYGTNGMRRSESVCPYCGVRCIENRDAAGTRRTGQIVGCCSALCNNQWVWVDGQKGYFTNRFEQEQQKIRALEKQAEAQKMNSDINFGLFMMNSLQ
jgi:hypothetical protein